MPFADLEQQPGLGPRARELSHRPAAGLDAGACPTRALSFGDINQVESQVVQLKTQPLNYGLLTELGTQPRTTYLAEVRNPNPALAEA